MNPRIPGVQFSGGLTIGDYNLARLNTLGVLNDDYEGGEFYLVDEKTDLSKGDVIIFPSNFMYPQCT